MTAERRARGTRVDPVQISLSVERETKHTLDALAANAGLTKSRFFELLMEHIARDQLSDRGVPRWMPQPEPDENELPIRMSA